MLRSIFVNDITSMCILLYSIYMYTYVGSLKILYQDKARCSDVVKWLFLLAHPESNYNFYFTSLPCRSIIQYKIKNGFVNVIGSFS